MKTTLLLALALICAPALAESPLERMQREQRAAALRQEGIDMNRRNAQQEQLDRIEALAAERSSSGSADTMQNTFEATLAESKRIARRLYPDLKAPGSPLARKWHEVYDTMKAQGTLDAGNPDLPLVIAVRAANLLSILPSGE